MGAIVRGLTEVIAAGSGTKVTVDIYGRVTILGTTDLSGSDVTGTLAAARFPALTGDVTTVAGALAATLANTAVTPGTYTNANIAVDSKGRVVEASSGAAAGDVVGPSSATDTALAIYNGTTGKLIKNSLTTLSSAGKMVVNSGTGSNRIELTPSTTDVSPILRMFYAGHVDASLYIDTVFPSHMVISAPGLDVLGPITTTADFVAPTVTSKDASNPYLRIFKTGQHWFDWNSATNYTLKLLDTSGIVLAQYGMLASDVRYVVRGDASQAGDLQQWQSSGSVILGSVSKIGAASFNPVDTTTNANTTGLIVGHYLTSANAGANNIATRLEFKLADSTSAIGAGVVAGAINVKLISATHASYTSQMDITATDASATRTAISIGANGSAATIGVFSQVATPVVQPTVTGSRGSNAALASLLTALASIGWVVDSSSA